jgi:hypothetical protein
VNNKAISMFCMVASLMTAGSSRAEETKPEAATLGDAFTGGTLLLNLRPRYERVDQDNKPEKPMRLRCER